MDEEQNILSASTNPAYGVTSKTTICIDLVLLLIESADDISANPAYGTNIGRVTEGMCSVYGGDA